jgi:hypothetical protein
LISYIKGKIVAAVLEDRNLGKIFGPNRDEVRKGWCR